MDDHSSAAFHWTERLEWKTWCKAFFSEFPKCDILLNNNSKVFNRYILEGREMPVLSMLEYIFYKMMDRIVSKQREAIEKWAGQRICPKIKKLDKNTEFAANCHVTEAGQQIFRVQSGNNSYTVDLCLYICDCRRWQLSRVPCGHSIACCREERIDPETLVHECYTVQTYLKAYGYTLVPLADPKKWEKHNGYKVYPPVFTKQLGRPKKNRKKTPEEKIKNGVRLLNKKGVTMHCSICGRADHNRKGHYRWQEALIAEGVEVVDENYDDPTFLQNIFPNQPDPLLDPIGTPFSMVYNMTQRELARRAPQRVHGPLPKQSAFVAAASAAIPQPRITTKMNIGRQTRATTVADKGEGFSRGRGRKRQRNPDAGRGATTKRGRGSNSVAGRGRGSNSVVGRGRGSNSVACRGRGANANAGRGRAANANARRGEVPSAGIGEAANANAYA
ncbi:uncharacterized protein LOC119323323 [Triticum dicoccoides]|uniref:uncharacterized protein LOC119323323 n=1 Tax=Triticum dicoccoides TaxID=85692 RepID=UPI00189119F1|nr:uncharacterized protein LOC119323323 [Triticum dicoccoides]XP_037452843.1 uncharacterized protein LOC119323323 [Triticum dicoccoides]XP_037452844.1 uncharacterized protein LOC119323323 [Triticum dicoccoides]XP_037452845.1 uncharacterized protein LOC119323323 [Triticum dicoccoides]XP_037452846.1 uncharacterized protein LOC119323323 [Triticum dicoccoides]XP_037452847.1 uncharacterized protein LOC119323323 [Triticum dicoccoides]XP_037452848.1 uncharacterized protein LOC119323323 [Triticum dic